MEIKLSTGDVVVMKDVWTRKADKEFSLALRKGVMVAENEEGELKMTEIPSENFVLAWEAVLPLVVEKIVSEGKERSCSASWLDELPKPDYEKLEEAAAEIRNKSNRGKKNS